MSRLLLINRRPEQRRVALIENGVTTELFFERLKDQTLVGNVYKGRVVRVLPGMQAAFVEAGLQRTGFLFVGDVARPEADDADDEVEGEGRERGDRGDRYPPIDTLVTNGQSIIVQISKMPMGNKGARLTTHISLPGRHLVYMPTVEHVGVSRRIQDPEERARLKAMATAVKPAVGGLIVRTASEGLDEAGLAEDVRFLTELWAEVQKRGLDARPPTLLHEDLDLTLRSVRDLLTDSDDRVVVDDDRELERILDFVRRFMPDFERNILRWDSQEPMFERYGVEWEITRASRRKVWLKSGGYILIDRTEALTAIDVNTGRFVGKTNFEETILAINLEAVKEIAYQLRLRDIGGIIVLDFIDMQSLANQEKVVAALVAELAKDRAQTNVLPISKLGLLEMTRKRVRNSIVHSLTDPCFYCEGKGYLRSIGVICDSILFALHQQLRSERGKAVEVRAHPKVTEALVHDFEGELERVELLYDAQLELQVAPEMHLEWFEVRVGDKGAPPASRRAIDLPPDARGGDAE
ncbi:MAG: Rne/Rng family ribonuclease [Deltaproteobacteria bacterium]|nr:Rne/Rng family ribonuclease [Deltaproteobacteria bacterium]